MKYQCCVMKKKVSRKANPSELDHVFMMGFDVWGKHSQDDYLTECRTSPKYARGTWYVLEDENEKLISSLIVYKFGIDRYGIGSIATVNNLRKQGYASQLIVDVLNHIKKESPLAEVFLYSDIEPKFYERFGFIQLPQPAQRYKTTTCMVFGADLKKLLVNLDVPEYF